MTQEEKELLFKDLCARLPYNVKCYNSKYRSDLAEEIICITVNYNHPCIQLGTYLYKLEQVKPYLFPLSSMTEEQKREYNNLQCYVPIYYYEYKEFVEEIELHPTLESFEYLYKNHFDYRGLIEKGLAIDATELDIY